MSKLSTNQFSAELLKFFQIVTAEAQIEKLAAQMERTTAISETMGWDSRRPTPRKTAEEAAEISDPAMPGRGVEAWLIVCFLLWSV